MHLHVLLFLALIVSSCATKKPIATPKFLEASIAHESIAVLPFTIRDKNDVNEQAIKPVDVIYDARTGGRLDGEFIQRRAFMTLAKKVKRSKLELVIQSFVETNKRIKEAEVTHLMLPDIDKGNLAKKLGVDAVIYGETIVEAANPRGANLGGVHTHIWLYDAQSGKVIWESEVEQRFNTVNENPERATAITIGQLMKQLPY